MSTHAHDSRVVVNTPLREWRFLCDVVHRDILDFGCTKDDEFIRNVGRWYVCFSWATVFGTHRND
jgi:hypothetical protein